MALNWFKPELADKWEAILGLRDYAIDYRVVTKDEMMTVAKERGLNQDGDYLGLCMGPVDERKATIYLRDDTTEETMIHELIHCVLDDLYNFQQLVNLQLPNAANRIAQRHIDTLHEHLCNRLAKGLLKAADH